MTTVRQRFRFLIEFARLDLDTLRPGDWLTLQGDLLNFLLPDPRGSGPREVGMILWPTEAAHPARMTPEDFRTLQAEIHAALAQAMGPVALQQLPTSGPVPVLASLTCTAGLGPAAVPGYDDSFRLYMRGETRDLVLFGLFVLLPALPPTERLGRCPECGKIALLQRNQRYCTKACTNKVGGRTFRSRHGPRKLASVATARD